MKSSVGTEHTGTNDLFGLVRFTRAQDKVYVNVLSEIRNGRKATHWMWFVFPQIAGLGRSETAQRYAIGSLEEAKAYLAHPVLGKRLLECSEMLLAIEGRSATQIFGSPDDMKLRSCATLFSVASGPGSVFDRILIKFFQGTPDDRTLAHLV